MLKIVREYHLIGVLCWILNSLFPSEKEFDIQAPNKEKMNKFLELYKTEKWPKCGDIGVISEKGTIILIIILIR